MEECLFSRASPSPDDVKNTEEETIQDSSWMIFGNEEFMI